MLLGTSAEDIGKFLNFQTLLMQGNAWTLAGNGTFSTGATIQSGTLFVNGQLTSPLVTVQTGGTLEAASAPRVRMPVKGRKDPVEIDFCASCPARSSRLRVLADVNPARP